MSTVSVVATAEPSTGSQDPPRVRLDVTDTGSPNVSATTVTRLDPDGNTRVVRTADGNPLTLTTSGATRVGLLYDYEMPYGVPVSYSTLTTPAASSAQVTVDESRTWLVHPGVPELSMPIVVARIGDRSRKVQRGVFYPMGRATPVVQTDGARKSAEYTLSVLTTSDDERSGIDALLSDAGALLLNIPAAKGWGITAEYVAVGDVTEARVTRMAFESTRTWELPCTVVDAPIGGSQAERNYVDILADHATYADLIVLYPTYLDLLAGPA